MLRSDYDKGHHDRLMAAAVQFNEKFASQYVAAPTAAPPGSWVSISGTFTGKVASEQPEDGSHRVFVITVPYDPAVDSYLVPKAELRFPIVPGAEANSIVCVLPAEDKWPSGKCTFSFPVKLSQDGAVGDTITMNGLEVRVPPTAPAAASPAPVPPAAPDGAPAHGGGGAGGGGASRRPPIQSVQRQPIPIAEVHARLATLSYSLGDAAPEGDCYPLSVLASVGDITPAEAVEPTAQTIAKVVTTRNAAIDLIVGESIGGIGGAVFPAGEGLPADAGEAEAAMAAWREGGHWSDGLPFKTPPFMLSVAVVVKRPVIVLERRGDAYLNPVHVYGAIDPQGNLVRTPARGGDPETIPSYRHIDFEAVLAAMRSPTPPALLAFDGVNHHSPFVRTELAPTEVVDRKDVGNVDELDGVPLEEVPYAAENIVVPPGGESHVSHIDQQLQVAEQLQEPGAHQMLIGELTDQEMNATMLDLGLAWKDEKQTVMIGTAKSYELIDQVESFLDSRLKVDAMTVIIPGVRRFNFTRSEFGQRLLSCMTSADAPSDAMGDDEMDAMGDDHGEAGEAAVHETPPEIQPTLPMAPNRPTNIARAKSLADAAEAETVAESAPVQVGASAEEMAGAPAEDFAAPAVEAVVAPVVEAAAALAVAVAVPEATVVAEVQVDAVDAVAELAPPAKRARRSWQSVGNVTATRDASQGDGPWSSFTATALPDERVVAGAQVRFVKTGVAAQTFDVPAVATGQAMTFPLRFAGVAGDSVVVKLEVKALAQQKAAKSLASTAATVPAPPVAPQARKGKQRAAAVRANGALADAATQEGDDLTHTVKASTVAPVKELSLTEALPPGFSAVTDAPLESLEQLFGRCVAYRWHEWGWACGRLAAPKEDDSNFTVLYKEWSEQQTLSVDTYGDGDYGSWLLLEGALAPPIEVYESGKYRVGGEWKRAMQLPFHTPEELKSARDAAAAAKWAATERAVEMELEVGDFSVGRRCFARGQGGDGEQAWFVSEVVAHRERYPPIEVKFLATHPDGDTSALALPVPRLAFLPASALQLEEPAQ